MSTAEILSDAMAQPREKSGNWPEADFRIVFVQHYPRIVAVLVRLLGERTPAEEVAVDAFLRLYRDPALQANGNLGGWLYRTATNLGIDTLRAKSRRREYEQSAARQMQESSTQAQGPLADVLREEKCRRVRATLASMKPAQAQLLILRAAGFSYRELADALDVQASGIGTMLNRAEQEFRIRHVELHGEEDGL